MRQRDAETAKKEPEKVSIQLKNTLFKMYYILEMVFKRKVVNIVLS